MSITPSTPDIPGAPGTECEEEVASLAPRNEGPAASDLLDIGAVFETGIEEDWASIATGDPAFWLKD